MNTSENPAIILARLLRDSGRDGADDPGLVELGAYLDDPRALKVLFSCACGARFEDPRDLMRHVEVGRGGEGRSSGPNRA